MEIGVSTRERLASPSVALFLALFASQAGVLVLAPVLVDVAREFDVSTAAAGQLRMLAAPLAAVAAVVVARAPSRWPLRELLLAGTALTAAGAVASAAAPSLVLLAIAQIPVWVGSAVLVTAGVAAAASWSTDVRRGRVVAYALAGPPAAWIAGMPVIGLVAEASWRLAFLAVPLPAAALAAGALLLRPRAPASHAPQRPSVVALLREPGAARWALGELLANAAWAGTLVYSGALFVAVHGARATTAGVLLAVVAAAYLAGNVVAGRMPHVSAGRAVLLADAFAGVAVAALWALTPNLATTLALFCVAAYVAAGRTLWGTTHGLAVARGRKLEVGAVRAVSTELGYVVGSAVGGLALAAGGYVLLAPAFGGLFLAAAAAHAGRPALRLAQRRPALA